MTKVPIVKLTANLLKISLLLALLPASASAVTITVSALNDEATIANVTASGPVTTRTGGHVAWMWYDIGDYIDLVPDGKTFTFSGSITGDGNSLKDIYFRNDGSINVFTLRFYDGFMYASFNLSGTGTINLAQHGMNFGQLNIGTFNLGYSSQLVDTSHTLVIEYVPDTGSTAALLGAGIAALAFARRRLG